MTTPDSSDPMAAVADLRRRLGALEDVAAITRRLQAYGYCLDYGDEARFEDCWCPGARLRWPPDHGGVLEGLDQIMTAFRRHTSAPAVFHKHLLIAPDVNVDGDQATVASMYARLDVYADGPNIRSFGRYLDRLVRCDDGDWRFAERLAEQEARRPGDPVGLTAQVADDA